jgi:hypothetical protein
MFVRLVRFSFGPGKQEAAQAIADDIVPLIAEQPGCQRVVMFGDHSDGEYGIVVNWNTEPNAEAAQAIVAPKLFEHFAGNIQGEADRRLFEVIASQSNDS